MDASETENSEQSSPSHDQSDEITENFCENPTKDILAEGFLRLFKPVVDKLEGQVLVTRNTQIEIEQKVNALHYSLCQINQTPHQSVFEEAISKLENIKNKITVLHNVLQSSQERLMQIRPLVEPQSSQ